MSMARPLIDALRAARRRFGPAAGRVKLDALSKLAGCRMTAWRDLRDYHRLLLFLAAYPDDKAVRRLAERELGRLGETVAALPAERCLNSGLPGSTVESPFSIDMTAWLARRYPRDVGIAWDGESAGSAFDDLLRLCIPTVEQDGLLDTGLTTKAWLDAAKGNGRLGEVQWLLERLRSIDAPPALLDHVFGAVDLSIRWRLPVEPPWLPTRRLHCPADGLRQDVDVTATLGRPLPEARPVPVREANRLIEVARVSLGALSRETDPVTYANPREVTRFALDRGIDVVLYGMQPDRRQPIESFFGYLAARNGVPVAYGGGWVFLDRSEIGINVFEPFRGGESAYLFAQILRVYHRHYNVRRFLVDPFQFGANNTEGIRSGAFWFYYRLGFRPVDPDLAELAAIEWVAMASDKAHRSTAATLRRLATGKLEFHAGERGPDGPDPVALGLAVTRAVGARFAGDSAAAERWARRRIARLCPPPGGRPASAEQQAAVDRLSLLSALIPDLGEWPPADRRRLLAAMRAKGGPREREYALKLQRHPRLRDALVALAAQPAAAANMGE